MGDKSESEAMTEEEEYEHRSHSSSLGAKASHGIVFSIEGRCSLRRSYRRKGKYLGHNMATVKNHVSIVDLW